MFCSVCLACSQLTVKVIIDCRQKETSDFFLTILRSVSLWKMKFSILKTILCFPFSGLHLSTSLSGNPEEWVILGWQLGWWWVFSFWCESLFLSVPHPPLFLCILFFIPPASCASLTSPPSSLLFIFLFSLHVSAYFWIHLCFTLWSLYLANLPGSTFFSFIITYICSWNTGQFECWLIQKTGTAVTWAAFLIASSTKDTVDWYQSNYCAFTHSSICMKFQRYK